MITNFGLLLTINTLRRNLQNFIVKHNPNGKYIKKFIPRIITPMTSARLSFVTIVTQNYSDIVNLLKGLNQIRENH